MEFTETARKLTIDAVDNAIDELVTVKDWHYIRGLIDMAWTLGAISQDQRLQLSSMLDRKLREVCTEDEIYDEINH